MFLTGNSSVENRAEALRSGGDDFLSKPFNVSELGLRGLLQVLRTRLQVA
jgi:DNA-binding response OmpR family regulator